MTNVIGSSCYDLIEQTYPRVTFPVFIVLFFFLVES